LPEDQQGKVEVLGVEMDDQYKAKLQKVLLRPDLLEGRSAKVVYTNLHGTGGWIVVPMLRELGFEALTVPEQDEQDGRFPTVASPNPENASALRMAIWPKRKERMRRSGLILIAIAWGWRFATPRGRCNC
jgi:phosphoglucomutase